ncbi:hypothetical protein NEOLEDRAFT_1214021 [Neolentinus lepideus HHB14362 ss-1]|uniref:BCS1 N-terminal domain-containing protein n=1 Tax=Neolentinus lepideus HHB14362 ss-1 TaxID=1314782 RepID=A0A165R1B3_9AGAM|nr:hypothetical protein NEOLEDRAFT_1214021 [Neolentinus lepideus HHB14362 ss-1]
MLWLLHHPECEMLLISVVACSNSTLKQLVLQAKREYQAEAVHQIQIYFADSHGSWRWADSRHKRPMSSIILTLRHRPCCSPCCRSRRPP